jgi:hypothetical protein
MPFNFYRQAKYIIPVLFAAVFLTAGGVSLVSAATAPLPPEGFLIPQDVKELPSSTTVIPPTTSDQFATDRTKGEISCFDYYKFPSVQVIVSADKNIYVPGDNINFQGFLENENNYPIVEGNVFVRISRSDDGHSVGGREVVEEFLGAENVAIDAKSQKSIGFAWRAPRDVVSGDYRAEYYFSVGKKFNLGGMPFMNGMWVSFADFQIKDGEAGGISFDRTATKVNNVAYQPMGGQLPVSENSAINIYQSIKNTGSKEARIKISYDLYRWDSLFANDKLKSDAEEIAVPALGHYELKYSIPKVTEPVYYLKITAIAGTQKSIINIRLTSNLERPRFNLPGISKFPLRNNDGFTIFTCLHNTAWIDTAGMASIVITDSDGAEVGRLEYSGPITANMMAKQVNLTAKKDYNYLHLRALLFDKNGQEVDRYEAVYDCEAINPMGCVKKTMRSVYYAIGLAILIVILLVLIRSRYRRGKDLSIAATAVLILFTALYSHDPIKITSAATAATQPQTQSKTVAGPSSGPSYATFDGPRESGFYPFDWDASRNFTATIDSATYNKNYKLSVGDKVSFTYSTSLCSWMVYGGPGSGLACGYGVSAGGFGAITAVDYGPPPDYRYAVADNPNVATCSGDSCTIIGPGKVNVGLYIGGQQHAWLQIPGGEFLKSPDYSGYEFVIGAAAMSWTVTVESPTVTVNYGACENKACIAKTGTYTQGTPNPFRNECSNRVECGGGGGGQQRAMCSNNACVVTNGTGYDQCAYDSTCVGLPGKYQCQNNGSCVRNDINGTFNTATDCSQSCSPCNNNGFCEAGEKVLGCPNDCACNSNKVCDSNENIVGCFSDCKTPTYALLASNNLSIVQVVQEQSACSNKTTISVIPFEYTKDVKLTVRDWGGFAKQSYNFSVGTLTKNLYGSGSLLSVCARPGASPGPYNIIVEGTDGKTAIVKLMVTTKSPSFIEI